MAAAFGDEIPRRAYSIWEAERHPNGQLEEHWQEPPPPARSMTWLLVPGTST